MTESKKIRLIFVMVITWGGLLSAWVVRGYFAHPPGQIHGTHESHTYVYRQMEFREAIAAGYLSPQWCTHFRGGLGAPLFSYYQPGFFYVGSLMWFLEPVPGLGVTLWLFSMAGYLGLVALMGRCFDPISGWMAGSLLLLSVYAGTDLYVRGDLTEYAAMMLLPAILYHLIVWLETGRARHLAFCVALCAGLVITHPCIALPGFGYFCLVSLGHTVATRRWCRGLAALTALFLGGALAAFYWMPIALEWDLVQADVAFIGYFHYSQHFVNPLWLIGPYTRQTSIPFTLGLLSTVLLLANATILGMRWRTLSAQQHRLVLSLAGGAMLSVFLMSTFSKPLWDAASPLQKLQFPWRLLTLLTVSLAGLCGPVLLMLQPRSRLVAVTFIIFLAWLFSFRYTERCEVIKFRHVDEMREIVDTQFFYPDSLNEWLPKGARAEFPNGPPRLPKASEGVTVNDFTRDYGHLACEVQAKQSGEVTLPHYFFAGWQAKLNGDYIALQANEDGLMQVPLAPNDAGRLELRFVSTPARRLGWIITLVSLLVATMFVVAAFRWQAKNELRERVG